MLILALTDYSERKFLTGLLGKKLYPKLVEHIGGQKSGGPFYIDFNGITASGSFFNQAILPLREYSLKYDLYPVICNADEDTLEELRWLCEVSSDAFYICKLTEKGHILDVHWTGFLEEKQRITFEAVVSEKVTTATALSKKYSGDGIGATGWNNRLSLLAAKGLIVEFKDGRGKSYKPVLEINA